MTSSLILKNNQTEEQLARMYGEEDYYWYLRSHQFSETFLKEIGRIVNHFPGAVLDIGCGEGQLAEHITVPYTGIDACQEAIYKAQARFAAENRTFGVVRLENFEAEILGGPFDTIVFGGILEVLVAPDQRLRLVQHYMEKYDATCLIVYDLLRFNDTFLRDEYDRIFKTTGKVDVPEIIPQKRKRQILVYRRYREELAGLENHMNGGHL
jgi:SAM-dependent methyltransferase